LRCSTTRGLPDDAALQPFSASRPSLTRGFCRFCQLNRGRGVKHCACLNKSGRLANVRRNPPRLVLGQQLAAMSVLPAKSGNCRTPPTQHHPLKGYVCLMPGADTGSDPRPSGTELLS
jgi:hypothetical protein